MSKQRADSLRAQAAKLLAQAEKEESKGRINGRAKGATFEREVANMIREAYAAHGCTKSDVYRTPMSGGHFAQSDKSDLTISPEFGEIFPYVIECKAWKNFHPGYFLFPTKDTLSVFAQVGAAVAKGNYSGIPAIVCKANNWPVFVTIPYQYGTDALLNHPHICFVIDGQWWLAMEFAAFLAVNAAEAPAIARNEKGRRFAS